MLVSARIQLKSEQREYIFNPENVLYIDIDGILFTTGVYRAFVEGEYDRVMTILNDHLTM